MTDAELDKGLNETELAFLNKVRELTNAKKRGYRFFISHRIAGSINFLPYEGARCIRFPNVDKFRDPEVIVQAIELYSMGVEYGRRNARPHNPAIVEL